MAKQAIRYVYPIVFIDCVHFNVKTDNMVTKKAAYVVLGVNENGYKEIFGIWIGENETAKFRLSVLTDLKNRGVKDILIKEMYGRDEQSIEDLEKDLNNNILSY